MSRVRERPSTSEAHNDFWCGMSGVHAGGDAKLLIKFAWPYAENRSIPFSRRFARVTRTHLTLLVP